MVAFTKLNGFVENIAKGVHVFGTNQLAVALSNTAPGSEGTPPTGTAANCKLSNVTQVSYTNLSTRNVPTTGATQTGGTFSLVNTDLVLTATGGSVGPFRYVYLYDDTSTNDNLIGYWDYGSSITLADGETLTIDFGASTFTLA